MTVAEKQMREMARDVLGRSGWLSHEPADLCETVFASATLKRVSAKTPLYHQGDESNGIYGVVSGCLAIESTQDDGRNLTIGVMMEGDWFGELSTIEFGRRPSSAIALTDLLVLQIPPRMFTRIIEQNPRHMLSFTSMLIEKVHRMSWLRAELAGPDPKRRVGKVLLSMVNLREWTDLRGEVAIPITQEQIASITHLSRQTVNIALKDLGKAGLLECRYGVVILIPPTPSQ